VVHDVPEEAAATEDQLLVGGVGQVDLGPAAAVGMPV
jgi:hypothetical protein